jgi:hypothetical protein
MADSMAAQAPSDGSSIPNFLMLDQIPANYQQQLETDILEPVVFQNGGATVDGFVRFTLQNKGFLHSHSKIFVTLEPGANIAKGFLQPHVGIGQIIKRAVLKIGNKTLNELDSWAGLHAVKSSMITNENNVEREMYTTGRFMAHGFKYNDASKVFADTYGLETGMEYDEANSVLELPSWYQMNTAAKTECPSFQIDLSDLFPFLKVNQLPLYMIKEPINIELTLQPVDNKRLQTDSSDTGAVCNILSSDMKFCADYIYYGASDEMERYASANPDLSFSFVDYRLVENTTSPTALASTVVRNLGMANRIVPRIVTVIPDHTQGESSLLGENNSISPSTNASGVQAATLKYNVRYNDRFEYTSDVDNPARLFSNFTQAEGVPFLTRAEFSGQSIDSITSDGLQGRAMSTNLEGQFFYLSTKLTNGRVGARGIELYLTGDFPSSGRVVDLMRTYCEYVRVARLSNGMFDVYNA